MALHLHIPVSRADLNKVRRNRGHPFLLDKPRGHWYPEAVGIVPGYPSTFEKWKLRQEMGIRKIAGQTRLGVPTGWGGWRVRPLRMKLQADARARAETHMENIKKRVKFDDERAEAAIETACQIMEYKDDNGKHLSKDALAAARLILEFTQPKPAAKQDLTIRAAENWLAGLADDAE